ncbi:DUF3347 domain-containing protein [Echinicola marina]|uniref:DUF3347 domain-containing protein n=1 Tax=Echinicola marina TaxID=2859768 RepID=UPI001CF618EB|nr:DUF3347 domain-containing protein [Echinicola marina]UCS91527.1 DUF3347 domain-containing protein [Echinicola marina]
MKKKSVLGLSLAISMILAVSCSEGKKTEDHGHEHAESMEMDHHQPAVVKASFDKEGLAETFDAYIKVKTALVEGDVKAASKHAQELSAVSEGHSDLVASAKIISGSADLEQQREAFEKLSAAVEGVIVGHVSSGKVYKQYCPMAFNNKGGYWLSDVKEIRNPYFGDKMLKCGRVEKEMGAL